MEIKSKEIQMVDIDLLIENPKNCNNHSPAQIDRLAKLIQHHGFRQPLIVSLRSGFIVAGHGRYMALKKIGATHAPVIYQEFKNEAEEYAFLVSDNAIASWSELDLEAIKIEMAEFPDVDLDLLGLKEFTLIIPEDVDLDTEKKEDENKKFILEVTLPNEMELADIRDDLISRGYIVKEK